jgi:DNA-binding transcriptional LysR family regulator
MKFSLRQMEVFLATARHENLSRAAETLALSQSAASGALAEFERQFGLRLFDRVGKRLRLNEQGRALLPAAEELISRAQEIERLLRRQEGEVSLALGATLSIGNYLVVPLMQRLLEAQPGARLSLEVANTGTIAAKVARFELDIGMIEGEVRDPALEITPWRDDELVVFCAPEHPLARRRRGLGDRELLGATWILREPGSGTRQTFDRALHDLLTRLEVRFELQHTEAIKRAVESGIGIGCLSRATLHEAFARGSLVPLAVPGRDFRRRFYFVLHRRKYRSAGIRRWLEICGTAPAAALRTPA